MGDLDRARQIVTEAMAAASDLTIGFIQRGECYRDPAVERLLTHRLVAAGLPRPGAVSLSASARAKAPQLLVLGRTANRRDALR
jgi:hypothetical protein